MSCTISICTSTPSCIYCVPPLVRPFVESLVVTTSFHLNIRKTFENIRKTSEHVMAQSKSRASNSETSILSNKPPKMHFIKTTKEEQSKSRAEQEQSKREPKQEQSKSSARAEQTIAKKACCPKTSKNIRKRPNTFVKKGFHKYSFNKWQFED